MNRETQREGKHSLGFGLFLNIFFGSTLLVQITNQILLIKFTIHQILIVTIQFTFFLSKTNFEIDLYEDWLLVFGPINKYNKWPSLVFAKEHKLKFQPNNNNPMTKSKLYARFDRIKQNNQN